MPNAFILHLLIAFNLSISIWEPELLCFDDSGPTRTPIVTYRFRLYPIIIRRLGTRLSSYKMSRLPPDSASLHRHLGTGRHHGPPATGRVKRDGPGGDGG